MATDIDLDTALAELGYDAFRPGQREAVQTLLERGRLLLVAPTGGGKSLAYQLPARVLPGTTLVVSPLISLMHDQVAGLAQRGLSATFLASTLDGDEIRRRMRGVAEGDYDLVYVAPERVVHAGFRSLLADVDCPLVAIDEAHCISEWGHDFRPEYMQLGGLVDALDGARVMACTATATPVVRDEIVERLHLPPDTPQLVTGFARPNLALRVVEVQHRREREDLVDAALSEVLGAPDGGGGTAIVYTPTRRASEQEAARLIRDGWRAAAYHAGLCGAAREDVSARFAEGELEVVAATNAFGMGIDRPDVRLVAHLAPPGSIEAYYQEVGRAGRDGEDAVGLLLISPGDLGLRRRLISGDAGGDLDDPFARHRWSLFLELMRWAEGGSCRHDAILRYFGDEAETLAGCGRCDVCRAWEDEDAPDPEQVTLLVRQALSAVGRAHGRFGQGAVVKLLRGADDERLRRSGLDRTPTFGLMRDRGDDWIGRLVRRLVAAGWVELSGGDRPVVRLTEEGADVMWERRPARLLLPSERTARPRPSGARRRRAALAVEEDMLDDEAQRVFEALRRHRLDVAREQGVPPYVVATDRSLRDLARMRPRDEAGLLQAHGIGPSKVERYGDGLLAVINDAPPPPGETVIESDEA